MDFVTYKKFPTGDVVDYLNVIMDNCDDWLRSGVVRGDTIVSELYELAGQIPNPRVRRLLCSVAARVHGIIQSLRQRVDRKHWNFVVRAAIQDHTDEISSQDGSWGLIRFGGSLYWFPIHGNVVSPFSFYYQKLFKCDWVLWSKSLRDGRIAFHIYDVNDDKNNSYSWNRLASGFLVL